MNISEFYEYLHKCYIDIWNIGKEYYDKLVNDGVKPDFSEELVQQMINKAFNGVYSNFKY